MDDTRSIHSMPAQAPLETNSGPSLDDYLTQLHMQSASDLYITVGCPAAIRGDEGIKEYGKVLTPKDMDYIVGNLLSEELMHKFKSEKELNMSVERAGMGRFRVNIMFQKNQPAFVIRRIVADIPQFENLGLPDLFKDLSMTKRGLILLTGVTASGKSTTLASMLDYRNRNERGHIITIEDPIEYFHEHKQSVITQREVGIDTQSFAAALKNSLRQRPDAILIGEIRDHEVMEHALTIAETGHLALATLHTTNAYQSVERIINFFPEEQYSQVRLSLSLNLRAIVSQRLLPSTDGKLVLAQEILLNEGLVKELILKGETLKIREVMEENKSMGMQTFDQALIDLYAAGKISEDVALAYSDRPSDLKIKLGNINIQNEQGDFSQMDTSGLYLSD
jgi:twitching motility protein PilU